jgi:hypothetical protein
MSHLTHTNLSRALVNVFSLQDAGLIEVKKSNFDAPERIRALRNGTERNGTRSKDLRANKLIAVHAMDEGIAVLGQVAAATLETSVPSPRAAPDLRPQQFLEIWNLNCGALVKAARLTESRRQKIRARLKEEPEIHYWAGLVTRMAASDFCTSGKWATIDWLIENANNHVKVSEGNYDNKNQKPKQERRYVTADSDIYGDQN